MSEAALTLIEEAGFSWTATGEAVLRNSLSRDDTANGTSLADALHRPYRLPGRRLNVFFRHDG